MNLVITGASRGIGFKLVAYLSAHGHKVLAASRNIAPIEALSAKRPKHSIIPLTLDLEKEGYAEKLYLTAKESIGRVDVLINNAGLIINKPFDKLTESDFDRLFAVNTKAPFIIAQQLLQLFPNNAHILNIGSMGGYQGSTKFPGLSLYSAAKGALAIITECLAEELKSNGIRVNCLALGATQTEMLSEAFPGYKAPLSANEMAAFVSWFALNGNRYFNGKILPVSVSTP